MKKADRKEYRKTWMAKNRKSVHKEPDFVHTADDSVNKSVHKVSKSVNKSVNKIPWVEGVDLSRFDGHGRGEPVDGLVLVYRRSPQLIRGEYDGELVGVVDVTDWRKRLGEVCEHGFSGWACKPCLA